MSEPVWTSADYACRSCGCDPDHPWYCPDCPNWDCPCSEEEDEED